MDSLHQLLARRIDERRRARKMTVNRLADFAGLSRGYLSKLLAASKSPTLRSLGKIAEALDTDIETLVRKPVNQVPRDLDAIYELLRPIPLRERVDPYELARQLAGLKADAVARRLGELGYSTSRCERIARGIARVRKAR